MVGEDTGESPEAIAQVHRAYFEAGADIAITASYQASVEGFQRYGMSEREALALIRRSVELARQARDDYCSHAGHRQRPRPLVAASLGPYGAFLADGSEYRGDYDIGERALIDFHRPRMTALLAAGPELLAVETQPSFQEVRAIVRLLTRFPEARAWVTFTARDGVRISDGTLLREAAAWLDGCDQVVAIGVNCTAPAHIEALIREIRAASDKPVIVYPNAGERFDPAGGGWQPASADTPALADRLDAWLAAGASIIGGCCRTTPADVAAIAARRQSHRP